MYSALVTSKRNENMPNGINFLTLFSYILFSSWRMMLSSAVSWP